MPQFLYSIIIAHLVQLATSTIDHCQLLDLTHQLDSATIAWPVPGEPSFTLTKIHQGVNKHGVYIAAYKYAGPEHAGTHWDAPSHFSADGQQPEQVEVERLIGKACVVHVEAKASANRDYQVSIADLTNWENEYGLLDECMLLISTGWDEYYGQHDTYLGIAGGRLHFPGLHPSAADWLISRREIGAIGIDTMSIDSGTSAQFECHRKFAAANIPIVESLRQLQQLPARGADLIVLPMKMAGGTGGPVRAIALLSCSAIDNQRSVTQLVLLFIVGALLLVVPYS